eukprot:scaffold19084_cov64-Cyclotella_meneghiniana.AAC.4
MATFDDIEALCWNVDNLSESELVSKLRATEIDPSVLLERYEGETLLHIAVYGGRSPEFCRVLHQLDATLVKTRDNSGWLPMHRACYEVTNVETAKYLFAMYPESINIPDNSGQYPIHFLAVGNYNKGSNDQTLQLLAFLLKHDKGAVSTPNNFGELPLHHACWGRGLAFVKILFDAHPDGIFVQDQDEDGMTPLDCAHQYNEADVVPFFQTQLALRR